MNQKFYAFLATTFLLTTAFTFTQEGETLTEKIIAKLEKYRLSTPQEKVYLHFDKPYYMAGETMWFKGYLFDGTTHKIDSVSRVMYVDLIDETQGKIIASRILNCDGSTHGDIALPDSLEEGVYQIRAYTNYMKNYSDEFFFHQDFKVYQGSIKNRLTDANAQKMTEAADVQFFPEGGNLVVGLDSRIGFKALSILGKGVDIQGFVLDNSKDTIVAFRSEHFGMGVFNFTPEAQKTYTAFVKQNDGRYQQFGLPLAYEQGFTMAVDNISNKEKVKVFVSNNAPKPADKSSEIIVVAHQRGQLCFMAKGNETQKSFAVSIPKNKIPDDGIVQITLINAKGEPLCERLIFNNQNRQITLKITPDKANYKIREKVTVNLEASDADGKPVEGNFSVAVTDANQVIPEPHQENLLTYLLLSSDVSNLSGTDYYSALRGNIEQPAYYFDKENINANRHLDILMMTQGWRRFIWRDLLADKEPKLSSFLETGLEVSGTALKPNGKVADKVTLTLIIKNGKNTPQFQMETTDSLGRYGFYGLDFSDSTQIFVQGMKQNGGKNLNVMINPQKASPKVRIVNTPYNPMEFNTQDLADFLKKANDAIELEKKLKLNKDQMLQEVVVKAKKYEEPDARKIYGKANTSIKVDNILCAGATSVFQMIQGRVAGVQVSPNGSGSYSVIIRGVSSFTGSSEPLYLLDGMPVDADALASISPCDVDNIDILKGAEAAIFGSRGSTGVIAILTKRGGNNYDYSKDPVSGVTIQKRMGYNVAREFYAPKYDVAIPDHVRPDFRSTLHWQPNVRTDAGGKASITYWNTDAKATMRIIAEGVSTQGLVGVGKAVYGVK
jgi:TonB-dependent SusC/RagA subfamily outer membrane receptor